MAWMLVPLTKKNDKRTKQTMTKSFVLVVVLKLEPFWMAPQSAVLKFSWNSHMRKNSYSQWPDFSTTHFSNLSITPHRSHFLLLSRTLQFYPWFLELSSFFKPIFISLEGLNIRITLYFQNDNILTRPKNCEKFSCKRDLSAFACEHPCF